MHWHIDNVQQMCVVSYFDYSFERRIPRRTHVDAKKTVHLVRVKAMPPYGPGMENPWVTVSMLTPNPSNGHQKLKYALQPALKAIQFGRKVQIRPVPRFISGSVAEPIARSVQDHITCVLSCTSTLCPFPVSLHPMDDGPSRTPFSELLLAVFNVRSTLHSFPPSLRSSFIKSILEVFILCLAGYILARRGIFDKKTQKVCSL